MLRLDSRLAEPSSLCEKPNERTMLKFWGLPTAKAGGAGMLPSIWLAFLNKGYCASAQLENEPKSEDDIFVNAYGAQRCSVLLKHIKCRGILVNGICKIISFEKSSIAVRKPIRSINKWFINSHPHAVAQVRHILHQQFAIALRCHQQTRQSARQVCCRQIGDLMEERYQMEHLLIQESDLLEQIPIHHPPIPLPQKVLHTFHRSLALNHSSERFGKAQMHPTQQNMQQFLRIALRSCFNGSIQTNMSYEEIIPERSQLSPAPDSPVFSSGLPISFFCSSICPCSITILLVQHTEEVPLQISSPQLRETYKKRAINLKIITIT
ncbi:carboxypeptidase C [Striga asiatica]|uniref:Carboxypeptidase C n=1 Tax=Striga asiatica TaxID=4170 RepID=A0A5A7P831_STRAF|nr:carboxypeptidase C [Striga asiatica]